MILVFITALIATFRSDYEYEIHCEYDFRISKQPRSLPVADQ